MAGWLLLHGFTGAPETFDAIAPHLEPPILAPALLGHGPAPSLASQTFQQEIERVRDWVRARGRAPLHVLGYSMGARLALGLLVEHPELFRSALLIGVNPGLSSEAARNQRRQQDAAWQAMIEQHGVSHFLDRWQSLPLFETQRRLPNSVLEAQRRLRQRHCQRGLCRALAVLGLGEMPSYWHRLSALDINLRLVVGEHDLKFRELASAMLHRLPSATLEVVPAVGHNVLLEAPRVVLRLMQQQCEVVS